MLIKTRIYQNIMSSIFIKKEKKKLILKKIKHINNNFILTKIDFLVEKILKEEKQALQKINLNKKSLTQTKELLSKLQLKEINFKEKVNNNKVKKELQDLENILENI